MMRTKPEDLDEKKMVAGILSRHEPSLRVFYRSFQRPLSRFIRLRVNNESDAEEILQDTFLGAIESLRDFSFRSRLFTFLCSIAHHKVIDYYRRKKLKNIVFSRIPDAEDLLATVLGPEEALDEELLRQKIKQTFSKLAPRYRSILTLKYIQGYRVDEIARKLSMSFKSVESQLFRARKAFAVEFSL